MKHKIRYRVQEKTVEKEITYIPVRYILAMTVILLEVLSVLAAVIALGVHFPRLLWLDGLFVFAFIIWIAASDHNPDYKIPWLLAIVFLPGLGVVLYFLFYSRKLSRKFRRRIQDAWQKSDRPQDDESLLSALRCEEPLTASHAAMLCNVAETHIYRGEALCYYPLGEEAHAAMLADIGKAEKFIFLEFFIIEEGKCWNPILSLLREKVAAGVDVRLVYDDIGCMQTLPGNYDKILRKWGIRAVSFSRLRGQANNQFNNRSHRKLMVIDGRVGYTGGINLADEYINEKERFGHWKDVAIRMEGAAVHELTRLFLLDYAMNVKESPALPPMPEPVAKGAAQPTADAGGYLIPFGDGPRPIYRHQVGKLVIQNLLASATHYVYMMNPYLIIDNDLCKSIESAALRGVDVRIIMPHIPDKKIVFDISRTFYKRLVDAGVRIYEYTPGFVHAKVYLADDATAMVGTINLDYRSLVHHFENGVWMHRVPAIADIRRDMEETLAKCEEVDPASIKKTLPARAIRSCVRILAPLL